MQELITIDNEFEIIQNDILGAHLLSEFCNFYSKSSKGVAPKFYLCFLILPLVYNKDTVNLIYQRRMKPGSFIKALEEKGNVFFDLQFRLEELGKKTFRSLNIAFASEILYYDKKHSRVIFNNQKKLSYNYSILNDNYQKQIQATRRIGSWFGVLEDKEILMYLNVKF